MPIKIPDSLPARAILEDENIFVMTEHRAILQDIRPLELLILNLMPTKIVTETQLMRKLSNSPLQVQVELLQTASYVPQHIDQDHLSAFYRTFDQVKDRTYDGMIITGAPVENLWITGRSCARSWSGPRRTSTPPFTSAGALRQGCTTTTAFRNTLCPKNCSACFPTRSSVPAPPGFGALMMCFTSPTPVTLR